MQSTTHHSSEVRKGANAAQFPPLDLEARTAVDTACAAFHVCRQPQTLRAWACKGNGPIRPLRVNGRLAWPTAEIRRLLGVAA